MTVEMKTQAPPRSRIQPGQMATARVSLTQPVVLGGRYRPPGETVEVELHVADRLVGDGRAKWTARLQALTDNLSVGSVVAARGEVVDCSDATVARLAGAGLARVYRPSMEGQELPPDPTSFRQSPRPVRDPFGGEPRVKVRALVAGITFNDRTYAAGDTIEVPESRAARLIADNHAAEAGARPSGPTLRPGA